MSDIVKDFNIEKLIKYLKRKNLKLDKNNIKIIYKKKIVNFNFFKLIEEKFYNISFILNSTIRLMKFIKDFNQKLQNYSLFKIFNNLKEILYKNKINREDIINIK